MGSLHSVGRARIRRRRSHPGRVEPEARLGSSTVRTLAESRLEVRRAIRLSPRPAPGLPDRGLRPLPSSVMQTYRASTAASARMLIVPARRLTNACTTELVSASETASAISVWAWRLAPRSAAKATTPVRKDTHVWRERGSAELPVTVMRQCDARARRFYAESCVRPTGRHQATRPAPPVAQVRAQANSGGCSPPSGLLRSR
jgi:hypothetical protein